MIPYLCAYSSDTDGHKEIKGIYDMVIVLSPKQVEEEQLLEESVRPPSPTNYNSNKLDRGNYGRVNTSEMDNQTSASSFSTPNPFRSLCLMERWHEAKKAMLRGLRDNRVDIMGVDANGEEQDCDHSSKSTGLVRATCEKTRFQLQGAGPTAPL